MANSTILKILMLMLAGMNGLWAEESPQTRPTAPPPEPLLEAYASVLARSIDAQGSVSYSALLKDAAALATLDDFARSTLPAGTTGDGKLAGKINRYNARVLHAVASGFARFSRETQGVLSDPEFFKRPVALEGGQISLNDYEATIRAFAQPAAHFAVNCGSRGCPRLHAEVYRAATLKDTLARVEREGIIATSQLGKDDRGLPIVLLLEVFSWYGKDYTGVDPTAEPAAHAKQLREYLLARISRDAAPNLRKALESGATIRARSDWDWRVNGN